MILLPAIDLFGGQAVRLYQGDYNQMTVYDPDPLHTVRQFERAGATHLHLVDLEGAKTGRTTNLPVIQRIAAQTNLLIEVGGGIRTMDTVRRYLEAGCDIVTTNTFGATDAHLGADAASCMRAGVRIAREAVSRAGRGYVAADMGPSGRLLAPYGALLFEDAIRLFQALPLPSKRGRICF